MSKTITGRIAEHGGRRYETLGDAAERIGVSEKTIRRWIAEGRLTGYRVGPRFLRVDVDEVDAMFQVVQTAGTVS